MALKPPPHTTAIIYLVAYCGLNLFLIVFYKSGVILSSHYTSLLIFDLVVSIITALFTYNSWAHIRPLVYHINLNARDLLTIIAASLLLGTLASIFTDYLNGPLYKATQKLSFIFWDAPYPKLFSILFICLQPALIEELSFRGLVMSYLQRSTDKEWIVMWGSAVIFGLLHLSLIGLIWLIPLGLLLAYFRLRHRSLWYGVAGHFCYNFAILWLEWQ